MAKKDYIAIKLLANTEDMSIAEYSTTGGPMYMLTKKWGARRTWFIDSKKDALMKFLSLRADYVLSQQTYRIRKLPQQ